MSCSWASSIPRLRSMRIACIVWAQELITERTEFVWLCLQSYFLIVSFICVEIYSSFMEGSLVSFASKKR